MRNWLSGAAAIVTLFCAREAAAACAGPLSATHYCVTHNGLVYSLDDGSGPVAQKTITVDPGVELSFELDSDPAQAMRFMSHPFYITDSAIGANLGTKYTQPAMSGTVTFTPTADKTPLYYQCVVHSNMGGQIDIVGADAGPPPPDAGADASTPPSELPDGSASSSSSSGGVSSSSSSGGASSSSSSGAATDAGTPSASPADEGGCNTSGAGASGAGILLAAVSLAALRRRRCPVTGSRLPVPGPDET